MTLTLPQTTTVWTIVTRPPVPTQDRYTRDPPDLIEVLEPDIPTMTLLPGENSDFCYPDNGPNTYLHRRRSKDPPEDDTVTHPGTRPSWRNQHWLSLTLVQCLDEVPDVDSGFSKSDRDPIQRILQWHFHSDENTVSNVPDLDLISLKTSTCHPGFNSSGRMSSLLPVTLVDTWKVQASTCLDESSVSTLLDIDSRNQKSPRRHIGFNRPDGHPCTYRYEGRSRDLSILTRDWYRLPQTPNLSQSPRRHPGSNRSDWVPQSTHTEGDPGTQLSWLESGIDSPRPRPNHPVIQQVLVLTSPVRTEWNPFRPRIHT